jgi:hypothetical protein
MKSKLKLSIISGLLTLSSMAASAQSMGGGAGDTQMPARPAITAAPVEQLREVFEGATVFQRISETEPTRLVIPGSRIRRTTYVKTDLSVVDDGW